MNLTDVQRGEFEKLSRPLIKWLNDNCHPHTSILIDTLSAEVLEGIAAIHTKDYLPDDGNMRA